METVLLIVVQREIDLYLFVNFAEDGLLLYFLGRLPLVDFDGLSSVEFKEDGL